MAAAWAALIHVMHVIHVIHMIHVTPSDVMIVWKNYLNMQIFT